MLLYLAFSLGAEMVYEWDGKRARRTYWSRIGLGVVVAVAAIGFAAWAAGAFGI